MKRYALIDQHNNTVGHIELEDSMALTIIDRKPQFDLRYIVTPEGDDLVKFVLRTISY